MRVKSKMCMIGDRAAGRSRTASIGIRYQRELDCRDLAFGKGEADALLDPRQGLVRIDPGPWQWAIGQSRQPLCDGAFRPMQTSKKDAGRFTNTVSDDRALLQLEVERSPDQLLRHLEEFLGQPHQLVRRQ